MSGTGELVGFDVVMERALYDPERGFFATTGEAGRRGDFLTSPEVGPLFGAVLARALDRWWRELGSPEPFTVVEAGAGRGALARSIVAADPACGPAMRYVAVERSARLRTLHPEGVESRAELPDDPFVGVVLANELLDNLPFRIVARTEDGWAEVRYDADLREHLVPSDPGLPEEVPVGSRVPWQAGAAAWVDGARALVERGRVVAIDYGAPTVELAARGGWLRTYRGHGRGTDPLDDLGSQDITADVAWDQLPPPTSRLTQAAFLRAHGIDELVEEGRRIWQERAHLGDLTAIRARSRIREADALLDPDGLGAFLVLDWHTAP